MVVVVVRVVVVIAFCTCTLHDGVYFFVCGTRCSRMQQVDAVMDGMAVNPNPNPVVITGNAQAAKSKSATVVNRTCWDIVVAITSPGVYRYE
jgi:hypothetical protein